MTRRENNEQLFMPLLVRRRVHGRVEFNDGSFAVVQTFGIDGIDKDIYLEDVQLHQKDTRYSRDEFREKYRPGTLLDICTIVEVRYLPDTPLSIEDNGRTKK